MFGVMMKLETKQLILIAATVLFVFPPQARSLTTQDPEANMPADDPIAQLRLTPEQRQRIRLIVQQNKDERQLISRRVREANVALDQALDTEPVNDGMLEQRIGELAAAQAAQLRLRIQTELRIRHELRPEQLATLRRLRLQVRDVINPARNPNQRPARQGLRPRNQ
jgi:Spy/CpxP family protein refolding chaperone